MKQFLKENILYIFIFPMLCICMLLYNTIDMDYWARLLQGNAFWSSGGQILKSDPFSYTQTHLWIDHEWGSSVIFSFVQNNFGFNGILILRTIIVFCIFFLIFRTIRLNKAKRNYLLEIILFIFMLEAMPVIIQSGLRCHFFTFLFFALFLFILEYVRKTQKFKPLALLPVIMLFWCNMHGGCVSGLGLIFLYCLGEFLNKKSFKYYVYTLLFSFGAMFINPYGLKYVEFILTASVMQRPFVTEWTNPFTGHDFNFMLWFKIFYISSFLLFLLNIKKIKTDYTKYIVLALCLFVSFKYIKNTPFIVMTSVVYFYNYTADLTADILKKYKKPVILLILVYFIYGILYLHGNFSNYFLSMQPVKTIEFIKINNLRGKLLAPFDMGSYAAYKLYPYNLIYMDGRYEEVYYKKTKDLLDNFYNVQKDGYKILEKENKPDYIIAPADALINDYLLKLGSYRLIYRNETEYLYSSVDKLKKNYILPSDKEQYYLDTAFWHG